MTPPDSANISATKGAPLVKLPRWLKYWLGGTSLALCLAILALWGTQGPSFILDLIAAYCF
jgi:hypothetical protein